MEELQQIQLKMEVAGTSKIEGADFAGNELDAAIKAETPEALQTRSQKQANAAVHTYRWIARLPDDQPINEELICAIHRGIVDRLRRRSLSARPTPRPGSECNLRSAATQGSSGGKECREAFERFALELQTTYQRHDPIVQALAAHYHFAAMHPFLDGNGRTARALEALMLQRAGLKDSLFIAMSNFYYDEKRAYLGALAAVRAANHNLTPFLKFALKGVAIQSGRLTQLIRNEVSKHIFRSLMRDLFVRLQSTRKRVIVKRQLTVLERLLDIEERIEFSKLADLVRNDYSSKKAPTMALARDMSRLAALGAITITSEKQDGKKPIFYIQVDLGWPSTITETEFFTRLEKLPKSKMYGFLAGVS